VAIPAFASSGGPGIRPSINGVPPIYILPVGETFFESMALSLMKQDALPKAAAPERTTTAAWNSSNIITRGAQVNAVGYIESLVFPARRLRLFPEMGTVQCTQCGRQVSCYVKAVLYEMGHWLDTKASGPWDDPFVAFQPSSKSEGSQRSIQPRAGKALWREFNGLFLATREKKGERPKVISQVDSLLGRNAAQDSQTIHTRCIWLRTDGKAKIFEWGDESLEAPATLLNIDKSLDDVSNALEHSEAVKQCLMRRFSAATRKASGSKDSLKVIRERMEASYWQGLAGLFRHFIRELAAAYESEDSAQTIGVQQRWNETLFQVAERVFSEALDQLGSRANALRIRVQADASLRFDFAKQRKEWTPQ